MLKILTGPAHTSNDAPERAQSVGDNVAAP